MVYEVNNAHQYPDYLAHHGILGQKWGIRRFQNPDGTLTAEGRERYYGKTETDAFANSLKEYSLSGGSKGAARLLSSPQIKNVAANVRKLWRNGKELAKKNDEIKSRFLKSEESLTWRQRAAEAAWKRANQDGGLEEHLGMTFESYCRILADVGFDDPPFDLWLKHSTSKDANDYRANAKLLEQSSAVYKNECDKLLKAFLGDHGDETYEYKTNYLGVSTKRQRKYTDDGYYAVTKIMNTWDQFEDDFEGKEAPIETLLRLWI